MRRCALFGLLVLTGCNELQTSRRVNTLQEAGTTHIAVLSVAPWANYQTVLQPGFALTGDQALAAAAPDVASFQQKVLSSVAVSLRSAAPTLSSTNSNTASDSAKLTQQNTASDSQSLTDVFTRNHSAVTGTSPSVTNSDSQSTTLVGTNGGTQSAGSEMNRSNEQSGSRTLTSGDLTKVAAPTTPGSIRSANDIAAPVPTLPSGIDPSIRYLAATALYQEVQLLNRYVKDAAIDDGNYLPYLVRLQVTLLPRTRNAPYDAYSTISFFKDDFAKHMDDAGMPTTLNATQAYERTHYAGVTSTQDVRVVPLLVTDDLESIIQSRSADQVAQLTAAVQVLAGAIPIEGGINALHDKLQSILGRDLNSTFTVARASDNTLRVRFGAGVQGSAGYAMRPQTHNVTLLVLLPRNITPDDQGGHPKLDERKSRPIHIVSRTSFVDAITGQALPSSNRAYKKEIEAVLNSRDITFGCDGLFTENPERRQQIDRLNRIVAANDFSRFKRECTEFGLGDEHRTVSFCESLWTDLVVLRDKWQYQTATATMPPVPAAGVGDLAVVSADTKSNPDAPVGALYDDGETRSTAIVSPVENIDAKTLVATLVVLDAKLKSGDSSGAIKRLALPSHAISLSTRGTDLTIDFPSLKSIGVTATEAELQLSTVPALKGRPEELKPTAIRLKVFSAPATETVKLSIPVATIVGKPEGTGTLKITVTGIPTGHTATLTITNAILDDIKSSDSEIEKSPGSVRLKSNGDFTLSLSGMLPTAQVSITAADSEAGPTPAKKMLNFSIAVSAPKDK